MKRTLAVIVLVVAVLALWWWLPTQGQNAKSSPVPVATTGVTHQVMLTEGGFIPKELTIALGDTVAFTSETGRPFWPASNLHPSHRDYPEFDPREPILADETWSFTFTQLGVWKYHDHLAPYFTGVIMVSE